MGLTGLAALSERGEQSRSEYFSRVGGTQEPLNSSVKTKRSALQKMARHVGVRTETRGAGSWGGAVHTGDTAEGQGVKPWAGGHPGVLEDPGPGKPRGVVEHPVEGGHPEVGGGLGQLPEVGRNPGVGQHPAVGRNPGVGQHPAVGRNPGVGQHPAVGRNPGVGQHPAVGRNTGMGQHPEVGGHPGVAEHPGQHSEVVGNPGVVEGPGQHPKVIEHTGPGQPPKVVEHTGPGQHPKVVEHTGPGQPPKVVEHTGPGQHPKVVEHTGPGQHPKVVEHTGPGQHPKVVEHTGPGQHPKVVEHTGPGQHPRLVEHSEPPEKVSSPAEIAVPERQTRLTSPVDPQVPVVEERRSRKRRNAPSEKEPRARPHGASSSSSSSQQKPAQKTRGGKRAKAGSVSGEPLTPSAKRTCLGASPGASPPPQPAVAGSSQTSETTGEAELLTPGKPAPGLPLVTSTAAEQADQNRPAASLRGPSVRPPPSPPGTASSSRSPLRGRQARENVAGTSRMRRLKRT
ncbi:unnamed protein product [Boreogadus saida]